MSAETELARFDTRRAAQNDENSEQTDFRTLGAREQGQLALDEVEIESRPACFENSASSNTQTATGEPARADLEAALGCARATIDGLREQVEKLETERDRLREEGETRAGTEQ